MNRVVCIGRQRACFGVSCAGEWMVGLRLRADAEAAGGPRTRT